MSGMPGCRPARSRTSGKFLAVLVVAVAGMGFSSAGAQTAVPIRLRAADGVVIHALRYDAAHPRATILLFHQAGSGKGEYATIAPRLVRQGFSALAIDQRAGGGLFGRNETAAALPRAATYAEAELDLAAAFVWARAQHRPVILWGSSYSAALVFRVAARHPGDVTAVLAFSPGEYLGQPRAVRAAAARVRVPIFVTSAATTPEIAAARAILAASPARVRVQYRPTHGVHGSSTLIAQSNPTGVAANWRAVTTFLDRVAPAR